MMDTPRGKSAEAMDGEDRISGLPDEMRHHIVSFLPARDAVRTCVLSPKWRHIWASARRLDVDAEGFTCQSRFIKFVNALLLSRGCTPLQSFWLRAGPPGIFLENFRRTAFLWIHHALKSNVEELGIIDHCQDYSSEGAYGLLEFFRLKHCPFTSSYLKKLHLCYVYIDAAAMKKIFSGCPALQDLEMINCEMLGIEFSSVTLKNLSINYDHFPNYAHYGGCAETVINMPGLVSLHIGELLGYEIPSLVDVQSLVTASIYLDIGCTTFARGCEILGALSNVKKLELLFTRGSNGWGYSLSEGEFANLESLTLSGWFLQDNCKTLLYLLEHSPNLEELILKISKHYESLDGDWFYSAASVESICKETAVAFDCEKLKKVEIICPRGDRRVGMLVTILSTKIISAAEISIKPFSGLSWEDDFQPWAH